MFSVVSVLSLMGATSDLGQLGLHSVAVCISWVKRYFWFFFKFDFDLNIKHKLYFLSLVQNVQ